MIVMTQQIRFQSEVYQAIDHMLVLHLIAKLLSTLLSGNNSSSVVAISSHAIIEQPLGFLVILLPLLC